MQFHCKDETNLEFLNDVALPSNIGVNFIVTQDNTGLVTITPFAEGATSFDIDFGDGSESENFANGESTQHVYPEGNYTVGVVATNLIGESAEITQELVISFQAPRNLEVSIENDVAVSRKVNITATAEFAATFEFYSGEDGIVQPVATGNIGDEISYDYAAPGIYAVKVVAKGGAIETTEYTEDFEVTEILAPITRAPSPPGRSPEDVISMYSDQYQQTTVDSYTTSWSVVALQEEVAIEGNQTLVYRDLAYAGIITEAAPINAAAMEMVQEVRRQFKEIPGILEGKGKPEYAKCVDISTKAALKEMLLPGLITIITPIFIGLLFGAEPLGGYMAGVCVSGVMWAIFQNNAGGAWDNAKKSFEAGVEIDGEMTFKGSEAHKAAVTGDTVGDPFKDTSGPSMNILIKLTCLIGLVMAPLLGDGHSSDVVHVEVQMERTDEGMAKGTLTVVTDQDGQEVEQVKVFEGTATEVQEAITTAEGELGVTK